MPKPAYMAVFYCLREIYAALLDGLGRAAALQALPLRLLAPLDCGLENFEMRTPIGLLSDIVVFVPLVSISN